MPTVALPTSLFIGPNNTKLVVTSAFDRDILSLRARIGKDILVRPVLAVMYY